MTRAETTGRRREHARCSPCATSLGSSASIWSSAGTPQTLPCAGCTSPSCRTRRRGSLAASCCSPPASSSTTKSASEFVRLLAGRHLAGLGFGIGFEHARVPEGIVDEARRLALPVFEVPYELPFIALTETAFTRLVTMEYEVLQRGIAIHKRLERLVLEERGLDELVRALAAVTGGAVAVLSARGDHDGRKSIPTRAAGGGSRGYPRRSAPARPGDGVRRRRERRVRAGPLEGRRPFAGAARVEPRPALRRRGSSRRATRAGSATSSGSCSSRP